MTVRKILVTLLLLAMCFVLTACGGPEATYKQAQELLSKGKYADAAKEFESLGSYEDAIRLTMYCKACVLCESGNYETGIAALENLGDYKDCQMRITYYTARSWDDGSAGTTEFEWMQRAKSIYNENLLYLDSMERVAALDKRIEKAKADLYDAAEKAGKKGNYAEAQRIFDRLGYYQDSAKRSAYYGIRANEDVLTASADPDTLFAVATRYSNMGNFLDCADRARSLTAKADKLVADQYARVASLIKAGKCAEAETLLASFWKYGNEKVPENYYAIAEKYLAQKEWDAASAAFKKAGNYSDAKSRINEPYYRRGNALLEEGRWFEAAIAFDDATNYSDAEKRNEYCWLRMQEEDLAQSDNHKELIALAAQYTAMGNSLDCPERAAALNARATELLDEKYDVAVALMNDGKKTEAYRVFKALDGYKDSAEIMNSFSVYSASAQGFAGPVYVEIILDEEGKIADIIIGDDSFAETPGLGAKVLEESFAAQFIGKPVPLTMDDIDVITAATKTVEAVIRAVNEAYRGSLVITAGVYSASAQGYISPVYVEIALDEEGKIADIIIGDESFAETPGIGTRVLEESFAAQFIGKSVPLTMGDIDAISGATITTNAVIEAINEAYRLATEE